MASRRYLKRVFIAVLACAVAAVAPRPVAAQEKIAFGITSYTANSIVHYIALEKKFYEAEKLSVDTIVTGTAASVVQQLVGGSLAVAQAATNQSLRAINQGAPIVIVAGALSSAPFHVVAAKGVSTWTDLKGKKISVAGPTDQTVYFFRVMARKNGLDDKDYDFVYAGEAQDRLAQMMAGVVAAAVLTSPLDFKALDLGYADLGVVPDYMPNWAQNNLLINRNWGASHKATVVAALRAFVKASAFFYDPANRNEVIDILAKYTKSDRKLAEETYDFYVKVKAIAPKAALYEEGIQANLDAFVEMGEMKSTPPVASFVDPSYLAEATR
jgi:ABC-type nitrate/sulfonate/bicarbonate transport system substrate-binding protein